MTIVTAKRRGSIRTRLGLRGTRLGTTGQVRCLRSQHGQTITTAPRPKNCDDLELVSPSCADEKPTSVMKYNSSRLQDHPPSIPPSRRSEYRQSKRYRDVRCSASLSTSPTNEAIQRSLAVNSREYNTKGLVVICCNLNRVA